MTSKERQEKIRLLVHDLNNLIGTEVNVSIMNERALSQATTLLKMLVDNHKAYTYNGCNESASDALVSLDFIKTVEDFLERLED